MNRDEAIRIAATTLRDYVIHEGHGEWATAVVARADALLAALGEPQVGQSSTECASCETRAAVTEARVVRGIADYLDNGGYSGAGAIVRCGDWRSKGPR